MKQTKASPEKKPAPRKTGRKGVCPQKRRRKDGLKVRARAALIASAFVAIAAGTALLLLNPFDCGGNAPEPPPAEAAPEPPQAETTPSALPLTEAPPSAAMPPAKAAPDAARPGPQPAGIASARPIAGSQASRPERPEPPRRGTVALVIDDAGNNLGELEPFLAFPGPLTIAVLPGLPHSAEAARRIRAAGKEVFLHQPMEALGGQDPGPQAVYGSMDSGEIRRIVSRNIDEIGPVAGINNHQGSKITMDETAMETVLALCRERGIQFMDSRTTADTAVPEVAKRLGMTIGGRDVFLDNVREKAAIEASLEAGLALAEKRGGAVMIGHTWSPELAAVLEEFYPRLIAQGYVFSTASRLITGDYGQ